jgi:predicted sugar kinase
LGHRFAEQFFQHHGRAARGEVAIELTVPRAMGLGSAPMLGLSLARALAWANDLPHDDTAALARAVGLGPEQALALWSYARGGVLLVEGEAGPYPSGQFPLTSGPSPAGRGETGPLAERTRSGALGPTRFARDASLGARQSVTGEGGDVLSLPALLRQAELAQDDREAWVFVFYLPDTPEGTPPGLGAARRSALLRAAPHLSVESGTIVEERLWPALERDDIATFGQALMALQDLNRQALAAAGLAEPQSEETRGLLGLLRDNGALAWGQAAAGLAVYGLIRGAGASRALRKTLTERVGIFDGTVMAAITDNQGARHTLKDASLAEGRLPPIRINR